MLGILIASPGRRQLAEEDGNRIFYGLQTQKSSWYFSSRDVAVAIVASTSAFTHPAGPPRPEPGPTSPALRWISLQPYLKIRALLYIVFFPLFFGSKCPRVVLMVPGRRHPGHLGLYWGILLTGNGIHHLHGRADPSPRRLHCCPGNLHRGTFVTIKSNGFQ